RATQLDATGETIARVRKEHASPDAAIQVTKLILYESRRDGIQVDRRCSLAPLTQVVVTPPDIYPIHLADRYPVNGQLYRPSRLITRLDIPDHQGPTLPIPDDLVNHSLYGNPADLNRERHLDCGFTTP